LLLSLRSGKKYNLTKAIIKVSSHLENQSFENFELVILFHFLFLRNIFLFETSARKNHFSQRIIYKILK